jgi:hypothetical protein
MIYQGDNWPAEYRGKVFMNNIHGACINMDVLERKGSGFVGRHAPDPIKFNDAWSQIVNFQEGPDGAVYFIDWYDKNQCHSNDANQHDRSNGRIFKISYGETKKLNPNLAKASDNELIRFATTRGDWFSRHARRILQERAANDTLRENMLSNYGLATEPREKLRWLWTIGITGKFEKNDGIIHAGFTDSDEYVRAWTIQFSTAAQDRSAPDAFINRFTRSEFRRLAREDKSPVVRLYLASAMQRLPIEDRWDVLEALSQRAEDADDHNIPLMVWYAAEPLPTKDTERALKLAEDAKLPNLLNFMTRRTAALNTSEAFEAITKSLLRLSTDQQRLDALNGLSAALKGQRRVAMHVNWPAVETALANSANPDIRAQMQSLSLTFGSTTALTRCAKL